jgi:NAD(P)-dependent dehydrogenase (short-subunit alcohol dehydrogenase family)
VAGENMEKIALVTGSTNNVGKGIAEKLASDGYLVVIVSRHEDEARKVAGDLSKKGSYFQVDLSNPEQTTALFAFIKNNFGRLDVLVNNVAYAANESIFDCTLETWERAINTNLRSYFLCTKYAAQMMKENGGGSIVNITIANARGGSNKFSYIVSKGGVNSLTGCAAVEFAQYNIRVNAIGIGPTGTPVGSKERPERKRTYEFPGSLTGHIGIPEDIAQAVSFLVSEKANYIYGAILNVDGGMSLLR